jgi:hypothetical protein
LNGIGSTMICPGCGSENLDDARFCTVCGAALDGTGDVRRPVSGGRAEPDCFGLFGGAFPGLVIGAIIIIVGVTYTFGQDFGQIIGAWGGSFGEAMGRWGGSFGESVGSWGEGVGRFFAEWGTSWGSRIGASIAIIVGLAILYYALYGQGRR